MWTPAGQSRPQLAAQSQFYALHPRRACTCCFAHQHAETGHSLQKIQNNHCAKTCSQQCVTGDSADVCNVNSSVGWFACCHLGLLPKHNTSRCSHTEPCKKCSLQATPSKAVTETAGRFAATLALMQATMQARKADLVVWWKQHSDAVCATTHSCHCCGDSQ